MWAGFEGGGNWKKVLQCDEVVWSIEVCVCVCVGVCMCVCVCVCVYTYA